MLLLLFTTMPFPKVTGTTITPSISEVVFRFWDFMPQTELSGFYSCLDAFVFPSHAETQGLVALEAMACGTPVVGVPVMALKDTIADGVNGYHYNPADTDMLMEKVGLCMENRKALERGCVEFARGHSISATCERLIEVYESLL